MAFWRSIAIAAGELAQRIDRAIEAAGLKRTRGYRALRGTGKWLSRLFRRRPRMTPSGTYGRKSFPGSIFSSGGERPVRPTIDTDSAPARPIKPAVPPRDLSSVTTLDGRVRRLRRAAAIDMFEQAGLDIVPGQLWRFVDAGNDVFQAVADFLTLLGLDVDAVRSGSPAERDRANDVLDLLVHAESAFARLSPAAIARIEQAVFSGEYDRVREAVEIVAIYEDVVRLGDRWPKDERFAAFESFLSDVAGALDDPLSSTLDDAHEAESYAGQLSGLMGRLDQARRGHMFRLDELRDIGRPAWERWDELAELEGAIVTFANLAERIAGTFFTVDELAGLVAELERINAFLEAVIGAHLKKGKRDSGAHRTSSGGGDRDSSSTGGASVLKEWEKALIHFGYARTDRPSAKEIRKRYLDLIKKAHPDSSAGAGDTAAAQEINISYGHLRKHFKT